MAELNGRAYDVESVRADFPILSRLVHGKPLVYLDNGASAQKPNAVIKAMVHTMENEYANVHRGLHFLSNAATDAYERAREIVRDFLNFPVINTCCCTYLWFMEPVFLDPMQRDGMLRARRRSRGRRG